MKTPICDFVTEYAKASPVRMHMPGHKGKPLLGFESLDLTEIKGADSLYEADGIIADSERNASALFGCRTFYSTEGSSQCIRAMLYLVSLFAKECGKNRLVLASRNAHKTFINTAAMLDLDIEWLTTGENDSYLSFSIDLSELEASLSDERKRPTALYITSPDYLGNGADVRSISALCRKYGVLLLVDNAHGAYLKFLPESRHPIDLGADMCCDSAHKTLPVLTGGAYLHIAPTAPALFSENAKNALALFGSTSPSYLILQSLDKANEYIDGGYRAELASTARRVDVLKKRLSENGYTLMGNEPLKITITAKKYGYKGTELADELRKSSIECEFADPDYVVLMITPQTAEGELDALARALTSIEKKRELIDKPPKLTSPQRAMSIREAILAPSVTVEAKNCLGRILAFADVGCPPAVPIAVPGEYLDENALHCFEYYGIEKCRVVK